LVNPLILMLFLVSGAATGWLGVDLLPEPLLVQVTNPEGLRLVLAGFGGLFGVIAGFFFQQLRRRLMQQVRSMPTDLLISRADVFFGVLGYNLAEVHGRTLLRFFNPTSSEALLVAEGVLQPASAKILDTSVVIDGRIRGLLASGLLEGQVIVPQCVVDELQALADSANAEKRLKGRRGLKRLTDIKESYGRRIVLNSTRYEGNGADDKLLKLTADTGGTLLTADYSLAQVARVQDLKVLNLSELVISLRPEVQPGDSLQIKIVREGKEAEQGVGYLEDGTMVVVEEARNRIGERLQVTVTGALQTSTGRLVFARSDKPRANESTVDPKGPEKTRQRRSEQEPGSGSLGETSGSQLNLNPAAVQPPGSRQASDAPHPEKLPPPGDD